MKRIIRRALIVALGISAFYLVISMLNLSILANSALLGVAYFIWRAYLEN